MEQRGCEVSIGDLFDAESIEHLQVQFRFGDLELWDGRLTVIDGQECDELLEVLDLLVRDLDGCLQRQDVALLLRLRFEQRLEGGLACRQLAQLLLVVLLLLLGGQLRLHDSFASLEAVVHSLHVEELTLHPDVGIPVRILRLLLSLLDSILQICIVLIRQDSLSVILVSIVREADLLVFHEGHHDLALSSVLLLSRRRHVLELPLLLLHYADGLLEIMLESLDRLRVHIHLRGIALLIDFEIEAVFFEDLQWSLLWQRVEHFVDFACASNEYLEFFGEDNVVKLCNLFHKALKKLPTVFDELRVVAVNQMLLGNGWNVAAWPSHSQHNAKCIELTESSLLLEFALVINTRHGVLEMATYFHWIGHCEL